MAWFLPRSRRVVTYPPEYDAVLIGIVPKGTVQSGADFSNFPVERVERPIQAGTLNEYAVYQQDPVCLEEVVALAFSEWISVDVLINGEGRVEDAALWIGDPSLADAGLEAARQWRFEPNLVGGKPVKVVGVILLTFCREDN